jgi:uncharacterized iron-regulated membrane protein
MRQLLVRLHRYAGLSLALFLALAGLTGSAIVFNEEIDAWLNPSLFQTATHGAPLSPDMLASKVERALPLAQVTLIPLADKPGEAALLRVEPKNGATLDYDQVFADPVTGQVLGKRLWGACCFSRVHLMPFLYLFHYTLQLPGVWGILFMGIVGCIWAIDCFVGFALTLPRAGPFFERWKIAWKVKRGAGNFRLNLDLHRAGGLWLWGVLLIVAATGVGMNLPDQVVRPIVSLFSPLKPSLEEVAAKRLTAHPKPPLLSYDDAIARTKAEAAKHHWQVTPQLIFHYAAYNAYGVGFTRKGENAQTGLGSSYYYFDDRTGALLDADVVGQGSVGDIYMQAQYQLHTGRILGLPGRILIFLTGLIVAMLSLTGVYVWARKSHWFRHRLAGREARNRSRDSGPAGVPAPAEWRLYT